MNKIIGILLQLKNSNFYKVKIIYFFMGNEGHIGNFYGVDFYTPLGASKMEDISNTFSDAKIIQFKEETGYKFNLERMIERRYDEALKDIALFYKRDFKETSFPIITSSLDEIKKFADISVSYSGIKIARLPLEMIFKNYRWAEGKIALPYTIQLPSKKICEQYDNNIGEKLLDEAKNILGNKKNN